MKKIIIITLLALFFFPSFVFAEENSIKRDIIISPSIIDEECEARDMLEYDVKIKNVSGGRITLYAVVNDISEENGIIKYKDPSDLDINSSLVRWLEFRRAVIELDKDEERKIPLKIDVHEGAKPGVYHARIAIAKGSNRSQAIESAYKLNTEELLINLEVKKHVIEKVEIVEFKPVKGFFTKQPVEFILKMRNIGNENVALGGDLAIYNNRGREIATVDLGRKGRVLDSGKEMKIPINIRVPSSFGKFKAKLRVEYGGSKKDLQDAVYFLIMPKWLIVIVVLLVLFLATFLALSISERKRKKIMHRHNTGDFVKEPIIEDDIKIEERFKPLKPQVKNNPIEKERGDKIHLTDLRKEKTKTSEVEEEKYVINLKSK